jgi:hypothetical protein
MAHYYKYNFVSPESTYATVKEELKSYFDTGAVDDLLFPSYLNDCLNKLGKSSYPIVETVLHIEDFQTRLPDNFHAVREAWMCVEISGKPYNSATSFYSQASSETTIQISPITTGDTPCQNDACENPTCQGECMPKLIQAVYKSSRGQETRAYSRQYLLKPGNISARSNCDVSYTKAWDASAINTNNFTTGSATVDSFDIRDNKFVTNFRAGIVHMIFYANGSDACGNQLLPDNYRIKEFVKAFIKYKVFETLVNQTNDETFNQLFQKMQMYKGYADEAYIMADIEIKKETVWKKQRRIKQENHRFDKYKLPGTGWMRNRH